MGGNNYIPQNAAQFAAFSKNIHAILDKNITRWTHIPKSAFDEFQEAQNNFRDIQEEFPADPTRAQTTKRNEAQKVATSNMRQFIKFYLRNPVITDDELVAMGIPPIDRVKTPHTEVKEEVEFNIHIKSTNNIIIDFKQSGTQNKAKPNGYSGAVIIWAITDTEPETNDGYTGHILATKTPHTIDFDTHESGKRVWVRACWQNARGILGRWSEAKTAIIP
ncbi:MAG: hypothetical protein FWG98_14770 [Candidatus Cloacimonetes bacterium]|nr:hypothetical protein [Candidatus Cloacimonadota bacterium]